MLYRRNPQLGFVFTGAVAAASVTSKLLESSQAKKRAKRKSAAAHLAEEQFLYIVERFGKAIEEKDLETAQEQIDKLHFEWQPTRYYMKSFSLAYLDKQQVMETKAQMKGALEGLKALLEQERQAAEMESRVADLKARQAAANQALGQLPQLPQSPQPQAAVDEPMYKKWWFVAAMLSGMYLVVDLAV